MSQSLLAGRRWGDARQGRPAWLLPLVADPGAMLAACFLVWLVATAMAPALFTARDPIAIAPRAAFLPPDWAHPFGTDASGRDILARIIWGTRSSLLIGVLSTGLALGVAIVIGTFGALGGRLAERCVARLLEVLFSFPTLILSLLFAPSLGSGTRSLVLAVGIGSIAGYGRLVFGQMRSVREAGYVEAARVLGHPAWRTICVQIVPNAMRPLLVTATMGVGQTIVWASTLSFLGLGAPPPAAEWGTMLVMGRDYIAQAWWLTFFPGLFIVLTSLSTTVLGRALQRTLAAGGR